MKTSSETFLKAIAPSREDMVVAVECMFTWYWLADLCAREGLPCVLGHVRYMKTIHGGTAKHDTIDAQKIAVLLRGGMLPHAYGYPAVMRATRDLLRRRRHLRRKRAALLTHVQQPNSQDNRPELGKTIAYKGHRDGIAARWPAPAVQKSIAVDLALLGYYDDLLRALEVSIVQTAKQPEAHTLSLLQTVPGIGKILSLVRLYARHASARFPRVQDCVSYCRLVTWAKESAGKRDGTSGTKIGTAHLNWAFSEAAVLFLRAHPNGPKYLGQLGKQAWPGQRIDRSRPQAGTRGL